MLADMAYISTDADTNGPAASSSATHRQPGARWNVLLGYLKVAGLCEQQLQDVRDLLIDTCLRDTDISISRMDGEKLDLTISGHLTAAGLKKRIASEWAIQVFSLQLAIGSTFLRDSDVIAEFVSSTERVVTAVVGASRVFPDRDLSHLRPVAVQYLICTDVHSVSTDIISLEHYVDRTEYLCESRAMLKSSTRCIIHAAQHTFAGGLCDKMRLLEQYGMTRLQGGLLDNMRLLEGML